MRDKTFLFGISIIFCSTSLLFSSELHPRRTALSFLKLPVDAKSCAISAYTAIADEPSAIHYNPAGLRLNESRKIMFTHNQYFQDIKHNFFALSMPYQHYTLGIGLISLFVPGFEKRTWIHEDPEYAELTAKEGEFIGYNLALYLSAAKNMKSSNYGVSFKLLNETIDIYSAYTFAVDFGYLYSLNRNVKLGFALQNIGYPLKFRYRYFHLPFRIKLGGAMRLFDKINCASDIILRNDGPVMFAFGSEFTYQFLLNFSLRIGYIYTGHREDLYGLSIGAGINHRNFTIDYSFTPYEILGNSHKITISISF